MTLPSNSENDREGVDRRGFLKCMAWAGTGVLWSIGGGVPTSKVFGQASVQAKGSFSFAQISDSHIGFGKEPYSKSVRATFPKRRWLGSMCYPSARFPDPHRRPHPPLDRQGVRHGLRDPQGSEGRQGSLRPRVHDVIGSNSEYLRRFGRGTKGEGWYSFDHRGVHFIGLVNVASQGADKGLGILGVDQLEWLKADVGRAGRQHADRGVRPRPRSGRSILNGDGGPRMASRLSPT